MPVYLVERFAPDSADIADALVRLAALTGGQRRHDSPVRLLWAARVPADESWFGWFEAPDAASVVDLHRRAAFPFDRISAAEVLVPLIDQPHPREDVP